MRYLSVIVLAFLVFSACSNSSDNSTTEVVEVNKDVVADAETKLAVSGMVCSMGCVSAIQDKLRTTPGVASARVNYEDSVAVIEYDSKLVNENELIAAIGSIGDHAYSAKPFEQTEKLEMNSEEEAIEESSDSAE